MSNIHLLRGEWRASVTRARHKSLYIRTLLLSLLVGHHGTEGRHMCLLLRSSSAPAAPRLPFTSAIFTKRHRRDSLRLSPAPPPALSLSLSLSRSSSPTAVVTTVSSSTEETRRATRIRIRRRLFFFLLARGSKVEGEENCAVESKRAREQERERKVMGGGEGERGREMKMIHP
jgi:hypothetical protein